jgi:hypothetical protein
MLSNNSQEISSGSYIGVPVTADIPIAQVGHQATTSEIEPTSTNPLVGSHIGVPTTNNVPIPQVGQAPTPYDYLALFPVLITAVTPLILGLKKKDKDKGDNE